MTATKKIQKGKKCNSEPKYRLKRSNCNVKLCVTLGQ